MSNTVNKERKETNFLLRGIKQLFCTHQFEFVRNIHGEEIIFSSYHRSVWRCSKCGKVETRQTLHTPELNPQENAEKSPAEERSEELETIVKSSQPFIGDTALTLEDAVKYYTALVNVQYELLLEKSRLLGGGPLGPPGLPYFETVHQVLFFMLGLEANIDRLKNDIIHIKKRLNQPQVEIKTTQQQKDSDAAKEVLRLAQKYEL